MPKYSYTVINQEGQKLTGTVEADSEALARESLNKLNFPIIDMTLVNEEAAEEIMGKSSKFEFQAIDQNGRRVVGTIAGEDKYTVFKRLVTEYHFAVEYVYLTSLSAGAKEEEKKRGVVELYTSMKNEEAKTEKTSERQDKQDEVTKEENAKIVMQQADFVLEKVRDLMKEFGGIIKPEDQNTIQKKTDRLARLKTSKNIDYVKHLAEDLLTYVQSQEIFLTKEKSNKKLEAFRFDMKRLMSDIHREKIGTSWDKQLLSSIGNWNKQHIENNENPAWWEKSVKSIFDFVENILSEPPEVTVLKDKIRIIKQQIWDYYKMYFKENTLETRTEIKESIRTLKEQRDELKMELKNLQKKFDEDLALQEKETPWDKINGELINITGWLLAIYAGIHIMNIYMTTKNLPIAIPISFGKIPEMKSYYLTMAILIILHGTFQIRTMVSWKRALKNTLLLPLGIFSIILLMINV